MVVFEINKTQTYRLLQNDSRGSKAQKFRKVFKISKTKTRKNDAVSKMQNSAFIERSRGSIPSTEGGNAGDLKKLWREKQLRDMERPGKQSNRARGRAGLKCAWGVDVTWENEVPARVSKTVAPMQSSGRRRERERPRYVLTCACFKLALSVSRWSLARMGRTSSAWATLNHGN